jgi:CheY-like chemotaxis protein
MSGDQVWRVLCVDDDPALARQAADYLGNWKRDNPWGRFECEVESNFANAIERLKRERFDLVTLDLHGPKDVAPQEDAEFGLQQGEMVLKALRGTRFIPVIFITGYADKISKLASAVVKVVKKGDDELTQVRTSASELYATGLPELMRSVDELERKYMWETVADQWGGFSGESDISELSQLLARRLAAHLAAEVTGVQKGSRAIEYYVYPALDNDVAAGNIYAIDGFRWVVVTPACDLAVQPDGRRKADTVILARAADLTTDDRHKAWKASKWVTGDATNNAAQKAHDKLVRLMKDNDGDRWRFLPGTFFIPDLVVDFQHLWHVSFAYLEERRAECRLDSPFRQEFLLKFSRYYGRLGTPDLDTGAVLARLKGK